MHASEAKKVGYLGYYQISRGPVCHAKDFGLGPFVSGKPLRILMPESDMSDCILEAYENRSAQQIPTSPLLYIFAWPRAASLKLEP